MKAGILGFHGIPWAERWVFWELCSCCWTEASTGPSSVGWALPMTPGSQIWQERLVSNLAAEQGGGIPPLSTRRPTEAQITPFSGWWLGPCSGSTHSITAGQWEGAPCVPPQLHVAVSPSATLDWHCLWLSLRGGDTQAVFGCGGAPALAHWWLALSLSQPVR